MAWHRNDATLSDVYAYLVFGTDRNRIHRGARFDVADIDLALSAAHHWRMHFCSAIGPRLHALADQISTPYTYAYQSPVLPPISKTLFVDLFYATKDMVVFQSDEPDSNKVHCKQPIAIQLASENILVKSRGLRAVPPRRRLLGGR